MEHDIEDLNTPYQGVTSAPRDPVMEPALRERLEALIGTLVERSGQSADFVWRVLTAPEGTAPKKPDCYACVHRRSLVGSAHSRCNAGDALVRAVPHGVEKGWFAWPVNFDPVWLVTCNRWTDDPAKNIPGEVRYDALVEIMGLLR